MVSYSLLNDGTLLPGLSFCTSEDGDYGACVFWYTLVVIGRRFECYLMVSLSMSRAVCATPATQTSFRHLPFTQSASS